MGKSQLNTKSVPLALLILCLLAYGPLILRLGLYWDDWPSLWFLHSFGPTIFPHAFAIDRPVQGWLWVLTTSLVGQSVFAWHLFGIITRWLCALTFWWALRTVWPKYTIQVTWAALLFCVYPGFTQQLIPMTYGHQILVLTGFLLSLGMMVLSTRKPTVFWPLTLGSMAISILCMFALEYFVGLELLRPVLLWISAGEETDRPRKRILIALKRWLPYLAMLILFVIWRSLNKTPRAEIIIFEQLKTNPGMAILELFRTISIDIYESTLLAWIRILNLNQVLTNKPQVILVYATLAILSAVLVFLYLHSLRPTKASQPGESAPSLKSWGWQAFLIGLFAMLIAGWPIWVTNLHLELKFPWDRFTLPMMFGASLFFAGVIALLARRSWQSAVMLSVLTGLAVGMHFLVGMEYLREWNYQKAFFWQLAWRAPGIKPGSTVFTSNLPFQFVSDNSLTAPLNWMYAPDNTSHEMPYLFYNIDARLENSLTGLEKGLVIEQPYRATTFNGSTSQAFLLFYSPEHCLKVIDPVADHAWPYKPRYVSEALQLSDLSLILPEATPARPPAQMFGPEPEHDWCYYFEKAELARQEKDWVEVARLGDLALPFKKEFNKKSVAELVTFIEGYARTGQWDKALNLTLEDTQYPEIMHDFLCESWRSIQETTPADAQQQQAVARVSKKLNCTLP